MRQQAIRLYYLLKPGIPRRLQIILRRGLAKGKAHRYRRTWPIDPASATPPRGWTGWPENKKFALILTHDVDTQRGHDRSLKLMEIEKALGFRSAFNFVPERYVVSAEVRQAIVREGFEVGVHGLNHDGKLYHSHDLFLHRARRINEYIRDWRAVGFRSPAMHHNLEWIHALNIEYDASTFDTDPFEPQSDGVGTIFPFRVPVSDDASPLSGYVEMPYTLVQDFSLFILLQEEDISVWKRKLDWIVEKGGMALLNTHPDYMAMVGDAQTVETYPVSLYTDLLKYITDQYAGDYWQVLPRELARYWREKDGESPGVMHDGRE